MVHRKASQLIAVIQEALFTDQAVQGLTVSEPHLELMVTLQAVQRGWGHPAK